MAEIIAVLSINRLGRVREISLRITKFQFKETGKFKIVAQKIASSIKRP